jgi:acyl carrier protein
MTSIDDRVAAVFRECFGEDVRELNDDTTFADIAGWDSLAHVNLINALEVEFDTKFSVRDLMKMNNVGAIRTVLTAKAGG